MIYFRNNIIGRGSGLYMDDIPVSEHDSPFLPYFQSSRKRLEQTPQVTKFKMRVCLFSSIILILNHAFLELG